MVNMVVHAQSCRARRDLATITASPSCVHSSFHNTIRDMQKSSPLVEDPPYRRFEVFIYSLAVSFSRAYFLCVSTSSQLQIAGRGSKGKRYSRGRWQDDGMVDVQDINSRLPLKTG